MSAPATPTASPPDDYASWPLPDRLRLRWTLEARPDQLTPPGDWDVWLAMAGRGWGKTRVGAEDVLYYGLANPNSHIAVISPTFASARDTCIEGPSGLLTLLPKALLRKWNRSLGELVLTNGTKYKLFSAEEPENLRGPNFHRAWVDELGVVSLDAPEAWDMLLFALRLGPHPQIGATTTPRPTPLINELVARGQDPADPTVVLTKGRTRDNYANLAPSAIKAMEDRYAGTRLGRQELEGELLMEVEGALWSREIFERKGFRLDPSALPHLDRIVVGLDPADGAVDAEDEGGSRKRHTDEQGICVAGVRTDPQTRQPTFYVLASEGHRTTPTKWLTRAFQLASIYQADCLVYERNHGGKFLATLVQQTMAREGVMIRLKEVWASQGKTTRAEPVAGTYEQGKVHHVGNFPDLEDQMCSFKGEQGEKSPDRMDALVWALWELGGGNRVRLVV